MTALFFLEAVGGFPALDVGGFAALEVGGFATLDVGGNGGVEAINGVESTPLDGTPLISLSSISGAAAGLFAMSAA